MARQDRQVVEQAHARGKRIGEGNLHSVGIDGRDAEPFAIRLERVGQATASLLVVDRLEGEDDVSRGERRAVREDDARPQLQRVAPPIVGARPAFGERRLDLLRDLVNANELGLREVRQQVGCGLAGREAVE